MEYNNEYFENLGKDKLNDLDTLTYYSLKKIDTLSEEKKKELKGYEDFIARNQEEQQQLQEAEKPTLGERALGGAISVANVPLVNFADETFGAVSGGVETIFDSLANKTLPTSEDFSTNINKRIDINKKAEEGFRSEYPIAAIASDILTGVLTGYGGARLAPQYAKYATSGSGLQQIFKQSPIGAVLGAGYDVGMGEGSLQDRADSGTVASGLLGGSLPIVLKPLLAVGSAGMRQFDTLLQKIRGTGQASPEVREAVEPLIEQLGGTQAIKEQISQGNPIIVQGNPPGGLAYNTQSVLAADKGVGLSGDKATNIVKKFLQDETDNVVAQTQKDLFDNLNVGSFEIPIKDGENILTYMKRINQTNKNIANTKYESAKLNEPLSNIELESIRKWANDPRIKKVIDADDITLISSKESLDSPFLFADDGTLTIKDDITLAEAEDLRILMDEFLPQSNKKITVRKDLAKKLRDIIDKENPDLSAARTSYRYTSEMSDIELNAEKYFKDNKFAEFEDYFSEIMNDNTSVLSAKEKLNAFRRVAQFQIEKGLKSSRGINTYIKSLDDPNSVKLKLLEIIYPNKNLEKIINDVDKANRYLSAKSGFSSGSDTFYKLTQSGFKAEDLVNPLKSFLKSDTQKQFSEKELRNLAEALISDNPDIIDQFTNPAYAKYFEKRLQVLIPQIIGANIAADIIN